MDKGAIRDLWRKAHKNRHGGDRGDFSDFKQFVHSLDCEIVKKRLGPEVETLAPVLLGCSEDGVVLVQLAGTWSATADAELESDVFREARRTANGLCAAEVHVVVLRNTDPVPSYADVIAHRGCRGFGTCRSAGRDHVFDVPDLAPDLDYVAFAACVEVPADEDQAFSNESLPGPAPGCEINSETRLWVASCRTIQSPQQRRRFFPQAATASSPTRYPKRPTRAS